MASFERLGVSEELCSATEEMGWVLPTDVQDEAIPLILGGGDVMIAAPTGSGKTGAFSLPLVQTTHETLRGKASSELKGEEVKAENAFVLNVHDRDSFVALGEDRLLCQTREAMKWGGIRATRGVKPGSGRWYYECKVTDEGLCRVGWSTSTATFNIGTDKESFGFGGTGKKSFASKFDDYGQSFGLNDVIGCYLDLQSGEMSFSKNGKDLGLAYSLPAPITKQSLFPSVVLKNAEMSFNFGDSPFSYPLPHGYRAVASATVDEYEVWEAPVVSVASSSEDVPVTMKKYPLAIVIEPTRELAEQVYNEITKFKRNLSSPPLSHLLCVGGGSHRDMSNQLKHGVNIVVGTAGCITGLVKSKQLNLSEIRYFVIDEADRFTTAGDAKVLLNIFNATRVTGKLVQVVICSATLHSPDIQRLADDICQHPTWVDLKGKESVPENVDHVIIEVGFIIFIYFIYNFHIRFLFVFVGCGVVRTRLSPPPSDTLPPIYRHR